MRFSTDLLAHELHGKFSYFLGICGIEPWEKCLADLKSQLEALPNLANYVSSRYPIELAMDRALAEYKVRGSPDVQITSRRQYELYAFVATVFEVHLRLGDAGKKRLSGMIRDGLRSDKGLASLRHEMSTAIHLMSRGFDVEFVDLERGGVDYIARNDKFELEIECKSISADIGRQVPQKHAVQLHSALQPLIEDVANKLPGGTVFKVCLGERLTANPSQHALVRSLLAQAAEKGESTVTSNGYSVSQHSFELTGTPFTAKGKQHFEVRAAQEYCSNKFGIANQEICCVVRPGHSAVIVALECVRTDKVVGGIARQLRDSAKRQFSKTRPGLLYVQLYAISSEEFGRLARDSGGSLEPRTGLDAIANELFRGDSTRHILGIVFRAHEPVLTDKKNGRFSTEICTQASGETYVCTNLAHPLAKVRDANPFLPAGVREGSPPN